ncbi:MAG TPA: glycosyltransferase family 39 protein [Pirellulales bacterium]|nr:glycosyltransferase family 39 protein [Pirellulales bacterium]
MAHPAKQFIVLLTLAAVVLFTRLGAAQLWDEDEPIFAGAALEMLDRGDWVVPYFNGQVLPDKPVLMYWVMIGGYLMFGATEFAARCGSALFGVASVLLTWQLGRKLFSAQVGFWAGVVLATSLNFDVVMRAATPDSLLVFFSAVALYAFVAGAAPRRGKSELPVSDEAMLPLSANLRWRDYLAVYAAMGVAALAKGPVGVVLPTATLGMYLLIARLNPSERPPADDGRATWTARMGRLIRFIAAVFHPGHVLRTTWSMRPLTAIVAILAVAGPWYVWVGVRTGGVWPAGFFGVHNLGRFLRPMEHHSGPFFYYVIAVLIGLFPWSVFLGPALRRAAQRMRLERRWQPSYLFLACWIGVYLVVLSSARTKLPNYILPIYPALALLVGSWIEAWLRRPQLAARRDLTAAWLTLGLVGLAMMMVAPIVAAKYLHGDPILLFCGVPLIAGAAMAWRFSRRTEPLGAAWSLAAAAAVWSLTLFAWAGPRVDRHQTSASFAGVIHQAAAGTAPAIRAFGYYRPSLVYYARQPVRQVFAPEDVGAFFREHPNDAFVFTNDKDYARLAGLLPADVAVLDRRPWFLRSREILLLGRDGPRLSARSNHTTHAN